MSRAFTEVDPSGSFVLGQTKTGGSFEWHRVAKTLTDNETPAGSLHKTKCGRRTPGKTTETPVGHTACSACEAE